MEQCALGDIPPNGLGSGVDRRALTDPLGTSTVAINHYRVPPGEALPGGLHAHADQEEVFVVLAGEATFETLSLAGGSDRCNDDAEAREIVAAAGEAVRFAPGEFQSGRNDGDVDLVTLALGAPRESRDVRLPLPCPECARDDLRLETDGPVTFACLDCGAERVPADCPSCGSDDMRLTLDEAREVVVACRDCDAEFEDPPVDGRW